MGIQNNITSAVYSSPLHAFGPGDPSSSLIDYRNIDKQRTILEGIVEQFNVGMYSALVLSDDVTYICNIGCFNVTHGFGYSDENILREGDEVIFCVLDIGEFGRNGFILARKPSLYLIDSTHHYDIKSNTNYERRTHFFSQDCYRYNQQVYQLPLENPYDMSKKVHTCNRPTDMIPGDFGTLNQHHCGLLGSMYSTTLAGGGAHIRLFSLENRIRVVADSIIKYTLIGNENEWHNRKYLSHEKSECLYHEERFGLKSRDTVPFVKTKDYHDELYWNKLKQKRQTAKPRVIDQTGYYGNLVSRYCLRPDPASKEVRTMNDRPVESGVSRESIDPSGQYRLATTGMLGLERIGRIPVPVRVNYPWQKEVEEPKANMLSAFKHDESHPYYRQLELADRVAYDLKNSYARVDEGDDEFYVPEEEDIKGDHEVKDRYDPNFTDSSTVNLQKYDKRRSGIWQGEDGSIILRDAWGSEIVMIGGNIQLSCAGNVEILPGKTALTLAGDDIVTKAQNSIDIEAADKDVRINGYKNVQIMAGVDDEHPGGITLEAKGKSSPWDMTKAGNGGETAVTNGILLKSKTGAIVTDAENTIVRARDILSLTAGKDLEGTIVTSAKNIYTHGEVITNTTDDTVLMQSKETAFMVSKGSLFFSGNGATFLTNSKYPVPMTLVDVEDIGKQVLDAMVPFNKTMSNEFNVSRAYSVENLDKMYFKFRNSEECATTSSWELSGSTAFTLYEPFWVQVSLKFETLKNASVKTKEFEDHKDEWGEDTGNPWPGTDAVQGTAKYAKLASTSPVNMTDEGFNKSRQEVQNSSAVTEENIFPGYQIRDT